MSEGHDNDIEQNDIVRLHLVALALVLLYPPPIHQRHDHLRYPFVVPQPPAQAMVQIRKSLSNFPPESVIGYHIQHCHLFLTDDDIKGEQ